MIEEGITHARWRMANTPDHAMTYCGRVRHEIETTNDWREVTCEAAGCRYAADEWARQFVVGQEITLRAAR